MSGVAGGDRIPSSEIDEIYREFRDTILFGYNEFIKCVITGGGSENKKQDHGDIDIICWFNYENKKYAKTQFIKYIKQFPDYVITPFRSEKYKGLKYYNSGEIVSVLYQSIKLCVQIDIIFALDNNEMLFKNQFLNLSAEKQGLILGLIKTILLERPKLREKLLQKYNVDLTKNEDIEYTLSSKQLQLRRITIDKNYKEINRIILSTVNDWDCVLYLLKRYDLGKNFEDLLNDCNDNLTFIRSRKRIYGIFNSMVSVKSGEIDTEKGKRKIQAKKQLTNVLFEDTYEI